jgi:hypothetical protein
MTILNLTQHNATADQLASGIIDLPADFQTALKSLLTFPTTYTRADLEYRALQIHELIRDMCGEHFGAPPKHALDGVMIGGMPSFMPVLEATLVSKGIRVGYACTERQSIDKEIDGKVVKTAIFVHAGMYWAN